MFKSKGLQNRRPITTWWSATWKNQQGLHERVRLGDHTK